MCKILNKGEGLTYHFAFSFSFGGWKLLFDIKNNALKVKED